MIKIEKTRKTRVGKLSMGNFIEKGISNPINPYDPEKWHLLAETEHKKFYATGVVGFQGVTGVVGPVGPCGVTGFQGVTGVVGPVGPGGVTGFQGVTGVVGPVGPGGVTGIRGEGAIELEPESRVKKTSSK